jgi:hypothetical protein
MVATLMVVATIESLMTNLENEDSLLKAILRDMKNDKFSLKAFTKL